MKQHFFSSIIFIFSTLFCITNSAQAALITTDFSELSGNKGTVDIQFSLSTDEIVEGFSLYFSEALFSDISIVSSPLAWDSIVFQPDTLLGSGLFDSFNPAGLISGSARIAFTYTGNTALPALFYELYDADLQVFSSGSTTPVNTTVPESSSLILILVSLFALALHRRSQTTRNRFHSAVRHQDGD